MSDREVPSGSWSADILAVILGTALAVAVIVIDLPLARLRMLITLPLILLFPGYAVVSLLFPRLDSRPPGPGVVHRPLGLLERLLLGVLTSAAVVPGVAYALNFTQFGIARTPLLAGVAGLTLLTIVLAFFRRLVIPPAERFRVPIGGYDLAGYFDPWHQTDREERPFDAETFGDVVLNVVLIVSIIILLGATGWAAFALISEERYTEVTLLTEDEDGSLVAEDYPEDGAGSVVVALDNHEGSTEVYTVVVVVQTLDPADDTVTEQRELDQFVRPVGDNERETIEYQAESDELGDATHLVFLVFSDDVPADPTRDNAYRWVDLNITES